MAEQVQPIEGITPTLLWNFVVVLLGLCAVVILVYKVIEIMRKEHERKEKREMLNGKDLTDEIADKVLEKLEPRFAEIDKKLSSDKDRLDNHETALSEVRKSHKLLRSGMKVTCDSLAAILDHELHNGNSEQMQKARDELQAYTNGLIEKVI